MKYDEQTFTHFSIFMRKDVVMNFSAAILALEINKTQANSENLCPPPFKNLLCVKCSIKNAEK